MPNLSSSGVASRLILTPRTPGRLAAPAGDVCGGGHAQPALQAGRRRRAAAGPADACGGRLPAGRQAAVSTPPPLPAGRRWAQAQAFRVRGPPWLASAASKLPARCGEERLFTASLRCCLPMCPLCCPAVQACARVPSEGSHVVLRCHPHGSCPPPHPPHPLSMGLAPAGTSWPFPRRAPTGGSCMRGTSSRAWMAAASSWRWSTLTGCAGPTAELARQAWRHLLNLAAVGGPVARAGAATPVCYLVKRGIPCRG